MKTLALSGDDITVAPAAAASTPVSVSDSPRFAQRQVTANASGLAIKWVNGGPAEHDAASVGWAHLFAKRAIDIVLAALAIVLLAPLLLIVALAIKFSSRGPVLFRQQREGLDGELFWALKFRSMRVDRGDPTGVAQTTRDDPRVTGVGRFIRKTSIDELPQLINVLRGDMSLVGPRPHVPGMLAGGVAYRSLVPYYDYRLSMRPGITGWAQANGLRGQTADAVSAQDRVDHDIAYIQNFSIWLDMRVIAKTVISEFFTGSGH